ncbi:MarR family winged helix-turn-helix transcriptional regulator [Streptomyces showdoensis]|uniref:MarR family winged helix-turn-helix transcriptional regulator n=1 Tax=Streptomyces showdoensis TaxID=68268 RepID=UPI000F5103BE|nr:MarR family transcriptional regulator [Streptomyces showdoensis]
MPAPRTAPSSTCSQATRCASGIAELLDILWEHSNNTTAPATAPTSPSQLRLMYAVDRQDGIRMRTVCQLLASSPPNITRMCDRLQAVGFLERLPCPDSGREVVLRLTPAGKRHLQGIRERREATLHEAVHNMPLNERHALTRGLTALATQLNTSVREDHTRPGANPAA